MQKMVCANGRIEYWRQRTFDAKSLQLLQYSHDRHETTDVLIPHSCLDDATDLRHASHDYYIWELQQSLTLHGCNAVYPSCDSTRDTPKSSSQVRKIHVNERGIWYRRHKCEAITREQYAARPPSAELAW
nr:hypothetical protein CFP56_71003 [Quercus suber]